MSHIELARWADLLVVAPATANTLARLAGGLADDLLTTLCLATRAPVALAPAMNQQMWHHAATQRNVNALRQQGYGIWGPAEGEQACGEWGLGRMLQPEKILQCIQQQAQPGPLLGKRVLITAGATREALDPVRCLTNCSSGKMAYALAAAAQLAGAEVVLVSAPTALSVPSEVRCVDVVSAADMHAAVMEQLPQVDVLIAAAAVTDYRPLHYSAKKIKKTSGLLLQWQLNPDIVAEVAACTQRPACVVGFAAETENLLANAQQKLRDKRLDFIIANSVAEGRGLQADHNAALLVDKSGVVADFPLMSKCDLAQQLIEKLTPFIATANENHSQLA